MFSIFTHVMLSETHSEPGLPVLGADPPHIELCRVTFPGEGAEQSQIELKTMDTMKN